MVLGQFVDAWGYLENIVSFLLKVLVAPDSTPGTVSVLFENMGMKQVMSVLQSLATAKLPDEEIDELINLIERLSAMNSKRNILVHGHWVIEIIIFVTRNEYVSFRGSLLREVNPHNLRIRKLISDVRNQKERVKHTFNLKRILSSTRDAHTLSKDIAKFTEKVRPRLGAIPVNDSNNSLTYREEGFI